jgi:hypothetical protein
VSDLTVGSHNGACQQRGEYGSRAKSLGKSRPVRARLATEVQAPVTLRAETEGFARHAGRRAPPPVRSGRTRDARACTFLEQDATIAGIGQLVPWRSLLGGEVCQRADGGGLHEPTQDGPPVAAGHDDDEVPVHGRAQDGRTPVGADQQCDVASPTGVRVNGRYEVGCNIDSASVLPASSAMSFVELGILGGTCQAG